MRGLFLLLGAMVALVQPVLGQEPEGRARIAPSRFAPQMDDARQRLAALP